MPDDKHVESLIQEAQEAATRPITFNDLKPHERAMVQAIGMVEEQTCLTDDEMISGIKSVLAYLEINLKGQRETRKTMWH